MTFLLATALVFAVLYIGAEVNPSDEGTFWALLSVGFLIAAFVVRWWAF